MALLVKFSKPQIIIKIIQNLMFSEEEDETLASDETALEPVFNYDVCLGTSKSV